MAYTLAAEIRDVRRAIQELLRGAQSATVSSNGGQNSYTRVDLDKLQNREKVLLSRYSRANVRKRTAPDFT